MTETIVDDLETIKIEKQNRELEFRIPLRLIDRALQMTHELGAIRKICQRIVKRVME
jgi:hypothetical protein